MGLGPCIRLCGTWDWNGRPSLCCSPSPRAGLAPGSESFVNNEKQRPWDTATGPLMGAPSTRASDSESSCHQPGGRGAGG